MAQDDKPLKWKGLNRSLANTERIRNSEAKRIAQKENTPEEAKKALEEYRKELQDQLSSLPIDTLKENITRIQNEINSYDQRGYDAPQALVNVVISGPEKNELKQQETSIKQQSPSVQPAQPATLEGLMSKFGSSKKYESKKIKERKTIAYATNFYL